MTMTHEPASSPSSFKSPVETEPVEREPVEAEPVAASPGQPAQAPPAPVRQGTTVLFVLNGLALGWTLFLFLGIVLLVVDDESTPGWIALPAAMIAVQVLLLVLTWKVRHGSRAAWAGLLALSGLNVAAWLALVVTSGGASIIVGAVLMLLPAVAAVAYLVAPRSSRRHFLATGSRELF